MSVLQIPLCNYARLLSTSSLSGSTKQQKQIPSQKLPSGTRCSRPGLKDRVQGLLPGDLRSLRHTLKTNTAGRLQRAELAVPRAFVIDYSLVINCPPQKVFESLLDLPGVPAYDPAVEEVELVTPGLGPSDEGVEYKLLGVSRPFYPLFKDFKLSGFVYIKLLKCDPHGASSGGRPTLVRKQRTSQGSGIETFTLEPVEEDETGSRASTSDSASRGGGDGGGSTRLRFRYDSEGLADMAGAQTTSEQELFIRVGFFKNLSSLTAMLTRPLFERSLLARKAHLEGR
eukprot:jgi/Mesen1/1394/ME000013S00876